MQFWSWFVNISFPQWVYRRLFPPSNKISTWNPNITCCTHIYQFPQVKSLVSQTVFAEHMRLRYEDFFASNWSAIRIHERGRRTHTLFSSCSEAQLQSTLSLFLLSPLYRMTRVRKRSSTFAQEPCNWSMPLGDGWPDFKALHCPVFTTFQESARVFWAGSPLNPSCAIFHILHKMIRYTLEQGLELEFWACFT